MPTFLVSRFESAVSILVADGSAKDRLTRAYINHLDDLDVTEFPKTLRSEFSELHSALHAEAPIGRETCVRATIRKLSGQQAESHTRTILSIYVDLLAAGQRAEPLKVVRGKQKKAPNFVSQGA